MLTRHIVKLQTARFFQNLIFFKIPILTQTLVQLPDNLHYDWIRVIIKYQVFIVKS